MKDKELRAIVLKLFYDNRRRGYMCPKSSDFTPPIESEDLMHICDQLGTMGYIDWQPVRMQGVTVQGMGYITASGIDIVEDEGQNAAINFAFPVNQNITFNSPSNVQIGNQNIQHIDQVFKDIIRKIDESSATQEEKQEAKSQLRALLEHPLVCAIVGGVAGSLTGLIE